MMALRIRKLARARRGQTMVLGVLGVLMVAITMLMTLNIGQSIHERIKLQQYADAAAFSNANQMARAMNFFAYTNRANVGALVAASSAHAYMAMATSVPELFFTGQTNFYILAAIEFVACATCCWPYCFSMCKHCIHGIKNLRSASKHGQQGRKLKDKVKKLDKMFINMIQMIDAHMMYIAASQAVTLGKVSAQILQDRLTKDIRDSTAEGGKFLSTKATENPTGVRALSAMKFVGPMGAVHIPGSAGDQSRYLGTEMANASRWARMVSDRNLFRPFMFFVHPTQLLDQLLQKCPKPSNGYSFPLTYKGESRVIADPSNPKTQIKKNQHGPKDAQGVGAYDEGWVASSAISMCIFSAFMAYKYDVSLGSGKDKATHKPSKYCEGQDKHKNMRCLDSGMCFMVYNGTDSGDMRQPHAYSLVAQDLRLLNNSETDQGPWKVTSSGKISIDMGGQIKMADGSSGSEVGAQVSIPDSMGQGRAMSKAMAYYHFPPDWKEQPNLFAPHWRAKLQPMRSSEALFVLGAGGQGGKYGAMAFFAPLP